MTNETEAEEEDIRRERDLNLISNHVSQLQSHVQHNYRVTRLLAQNLLLTSKVKFRFSLARPGQAKPKRNFCLEVNRRFCTT